MTSQAADLHSRLTARRALLAAAAAVVLLAGLVALGRWERQRQIDRQVRGMASIQALVGPLDASSLSGFRALPAFDCLTYRRGPNPFALELCFDRRGRLVEAIDRRTSTRHIYTLRSEAAASSIRVDRVEVDRLLRKMGAIP